MRAGLPARMRPRAPADPAFGAAASSRRSRRAASGDRRTEIALGALAVGVLALIGLMVFTVVRNAWPSFSTNGSSWFGSGGDVVTQFRAMQEGVALPGHPLLYFRAWPLIWGTCSRRVSRADSDRHLDARRCLPRRVRAPPVRRVLDPVVRLLRVCHRSCTA